MTTEKTFDEEQGDHYDMEDPPVVVEDVEHDGNNDKHVDQKNDVKTTSNKEDVDITETEDVQDGDDTGNNNNNASSNDDDDTGTGDDVTFSTMMLLKLNKEQIPLTAYIFASMIFLIAVAITGNDIIQWYGYGLSVGIIGMVLGICGLVMDYFKPEYQKYMSGLILVWASIGAFLFTFANSSPFRFTGNGYFALWGMVISASVHAGVTKEAVQQQISTLSSYVGLLICSVVMVIATSFVIADAEGYFGFASHRGNTILMICIACLSILLTGGILYYQSHIDAFQQQHQCVIAKVQFGLVLCFCILWIVSAGLCTFQGPFQYTGNGYFASWFGAVLSIFATLDSYQKMQQQSKK